jgi:hypothetical protein
LLRDLQIDGKVDEIDKEKPQAAATTWGQEQKSPLATGIPLPFSIVADQEA